MSWRASLRHAFAVDPPGPIEPTGDERAAVDWFCGQVARRRLATPGLIALEMSRPLNYVASQAMRAIAPGVWAITSDPTHEQYLHFASFLERRGSVEYLERRIEELERRGRPGRDSGAGEHPPAPEHREEAPRS